MKLNSATPSISVNVLVNDNPLSGRKVEDDELPLILLCTALIFAAQRASMLYLATTPYAGLYPKPLAIEKALTEKWFPDRVLHTA